MTVLERKFEGQDLLIPKEVIESLGVKPGEYIVIYPKMDLSQAEFDAEKQANLLKVLDILYGIWTAEDETEFRRAREEMWNSWAHRSLS